jgi:hypothetical protein
VCSPECPRDGPAGLKLSDGRPGASRDGRRLSSKPPEARLGLCDLRDQGVEVAGVDLRRRRDVQLIERRPQLGRLALRRLDIAGVDLRGHDLVDWVGHAGHVGRPRREDLVDRVDPARRLGRPRRRGGCLDHLGFRRGLGGALQAERRQAWRDRPRLLALPEQERGGEALRLGLGLGDLDLQLVERGDDRGQAVPAPFQRGDLLVDVVDAQAAQLGSDGRVSGLAVPLGPQPGDVGLDRRTLALDLSTLQEGLAGWRAGAETPSRRRMSSSEVRLAIGDPLRPWRGGGELQRGRAPP